MLYEVGPNYARKTDVDSMNVAARLVEDLRMVDKVHLRRTCVPLESYKLCFSRFRKQLQ